jgi:hypothetical protein
MIKSFITQREQFELRRKNIKAHINLLERRYSKAERQETITALQARLALIEMQEHREGAEE